MTGVTMRSVAVGASALLLFVALSPEVQAETPSPSPTSTLTAAPPPESPTPSSPAPTSPTPPTSTSRSPAPPAPTPRELASEASDAPGLTLVLTSSGGPVADAFYEDLGSFAFAGEVTGVPDGAVVTISRRVSAGVWAAVATAPVVTGRYAASAPVKEGGGVSFRATLAIGDGSVVASPWATVSVRDATVSLTRRATAVDSLKNVTLTGSVVPARAGVAVGVDVRKGSAWVPVGTATTDGTGGFVTTSGYDRGGLGTYAVRARYQAANRNRTEVGGTQWFTRTAVLDAEVDATTSADVAKTYRKGCPVGPSKLRTVNLNYYGRDKRIHRGVIIVRADLTQEITRAFDTALRHRYPIEKMNNPNVYGGNDPKQMKANNTSGFNCRKVVGNPYAQSPHSYGIALDVNTVQNPYRDVHGKWWPSNGKSYIKRSHARWGMLYTGSYLTASLRHDDFFWGGLWKPDRDYQHFEYRG